MPLTDAQLRHFDASQLRLPADKRTEYHRQVDGLIDGLRRGLARDAGVRVANVVKAGSFAKHTMLRKSAEDPVDVDVVFYIDGRTPDTATLETLTDEIYNLLVGAYPNKSVSDFEIQRRATAVSFIGTGLGVDVVPVIADPSHPGYGWQFDTQDRTYHRTCATCQIKFVQDRKNKDRDFRTLVRLAKKWRNHMEIEPLKSYAVELILAWLLDREGSADPIESRFHGFLLYIAQSGLREVIRFPENTGTVPVFRDPVAILDPVCNDNNVAARITEAERGMIVEAAKTSWETAVFASVENERRFWRELLGPRFDIKE